MKEEISYLLFIILSLLILFYIGRCAYIRQENFMDKNKIILNQSIPNIGGPKPVGLPIGEFLKTIQQMNQSLVEIKEILKRAYPDKDEQWRRKGQEL